MQEQELTPNMNYDLPERLVHELSEFAREHAIDRIVLFGARARKPALFVPRVHCDTQKLLRM